MSIPLLATLSILVAASIPAQEKATARDDRALFEREVSPLLIEDCRVYIRDRLAITAFPGLGLEQPAQRYASRDFRRTDVGGRVVREIFA